MKEGKFLKNSVQREVEVKPHWSQRKQTSPDLGDLVLNLDAGVEICFANVKFTPVTLQFRIAALHISVRREETEESCGLGCGLVLPFSHPALPSQQVLRHRGYR